MKDIYFFKKEREEQIKIHLYIYTNLNIQHPNSTVDFTKYKLRVFY